MEAVLETVASSPQAATMEAVLETVASSPRAATAGAVLETKASSPEDVAREELAVVICEKDAETLVPHIDLQGYGSALLERDHAVITGYGLLERKGGEPVQRMRQQPGPGGMEML